ncbi:TraB/GumN family protein [Chitinophaga pinensis]|nr:TraB/GumN family protein [Chitinophaga pinensis]
MPAVKLFKTHTETDRLSAQQTKDTAVTSSLLWKISGNDLEKPSWLYGIIDVFCSQQPHIPEAVRTALKQSRSLYLPTDILVPGPEKEKAIRAAITMPEGYSFKKLFSEAEYKELREWFPDSLKTRLASMDRVRPAIINALIIYMAFAPFCKEQVYDGTELVKLAQAQQLPVFGLEEIADEIAVADSIPDEEEAQMMLKIIRNPQKMDSLFRGIINAYKIQDIDSILIAMTATEDMQRHKAMMLDHRNYKWAPLIIDQALWAPSFFAIPAVHLGGSTGLVALLRKEGYTVTPVLMQ